MHRQVAGFAFQERKNYATAANRSGLYPVPIPYQKYLHRHSFLRLS